MLICFDVDGTLIDDTEFIWYTLHRHFGVEWGRVEKWHRMYIEGKITYDQWFAQDIRWWNEAGARKKDFFDAVSRLSLMKGAKETIAELKRRSYKLAVISGSLNIVLEHFFPEKPFDHVFVNEIFFDRKGRISGRRTTPYDHGHKATALRMVAEKEGIPLRDTVFVGDNYNDIEALKAAGLGIAFNWKAQDIRDAADVGVAGQDISAILGVV